MHFVPELDSPTPTPPSPRALIAEALADFITANHLNSPFGGTVTRSGDKRHYLVDFSLPANLDGLIRVFSPTYIMISSRGRLAPNGDDTRILGSLNDARDFLRLAFVESKRAQAEQIPSKEPKSRNSASSSPRRFPPPQPAPRDFKHYGVPEDPLPL
jgi:hypothetical protein